MKKRAKRPLASNTAASNAAEVGQSFAVTRERIRQIEAKALRKLGTQAGRGSCGRSWMA